MIFWEMMRAWIIVKLIWNSLCSTVYLWVCLWVFPVSYFAHYVGRTFWYFLIPQRAGYDIPFVLAINLHLPASWRLSSGLHYQHLLGTVQLQSLLASFIIFPLVFSKSKSAHHIKQYFMQHTHTYIHRHTQLSRTRRRCLGNLFSFPSNILRCLSAALRCLYIFLLPLPRRGGLHKIWLFLIKYACKRYKKLFVCFLSRERSAAEQRQQISI